VISKSVRTKNNHGKTPHQVAKSEYIRRLIQAFDDGRLPLFRHPRVISPCGSQRRMTDFIYHRTVSSCSIIGDGKPFMKTLSFKTFSNNAQEGHAMSGNQASEDEFGIIDVFTPRSSEHQNVKRLSSSRS
jgi:hypothetical protein